MAGHYSVEHGVGRADLRGFLSSGPDRQSVTAARASVSRSARRSADRLGARPQLRGRRAANGGLQPRPPRRPSDSEGSSKQKPASAHHLWRRSPLARRRVSKSRELASRERNTGFYDKFTNS